MIHCEVSSEAPYAYHLGLGLGLELELGLRLGSFPTARIIPTTSPRFRFGTSVCVLISIPASIVNCTTLS